MGHPTQDQRAHAERIAQLVQEAVEPFIRAKFDSEPIERRPLPAVEVDYDGKIEYRSVKDIVALSRRPPPPPPLLFSDSSRDRRWPGDGLGAPNRAAAAAAVSSASVSSAAAVPFSSGEKRPQSYYVDVDAPKVIYSYS